MPADDEDVPVTVTLSRSVVPGREAEFQRWASQLTEVASGFPGFLGAGLLLPGPAGGDWHVVYRFDSADHLDAWERSPQRGEILAAAADFMTTTGRRDHTGLETWFNPPGVPSPPRWKMFVVSLAGIFTLQLAFNLFLAAIGIDANVVVRVAIIATAVTALMTWAVMPRVARLLEGWLYRDTV
ncbi:MAG TPA: antibiotic biosynthesis monooxygenase [Jiangellaceae bacterium]